MSMINFVSDEKLLFAKHSSYWRLIIFDLLHVAQACCVRNISSYSYLI